MTVERAKGKRETWRADAARDRVRKLVNTLDGMCSGLDVIDVSRALSSAEAAEIKEWNDCLTRSLRALRALRVAIEGGE